MVQIFTGSEPATTVRTRAICYATGILPTHAGTPYLPIETTEVRNGARIVHSAHFNSSMLSSTGRTFVVGAHKAALDILKTFEPSKHVVWAHRGHAIFICKEQMERAGQKMVGKDPPWVAHKMMKMSMRMVYSGRFSSAEHWMLKSGMGCEVGKPASTAGCRFRGGLASEKDLEHVRKFEQLVFKEIKVNDEGEMAMVVADGSSTIAGPGDLVIMCTGQRCAQTVEEYLKAATKNSASGRFHTLPLSSQAGTAAMFTTKLCLDYLDRKAAPLYDGGGVTAALHDVAAQCTSLAEQSSAATYGLRSKTMVMTAGVQLKLADTIFPTLRGDLAMSKLWLGEFYGKDLDAREILNDFSTAPSTCLQGVRTAIARSVGYNKRCPRVEPVSVL